jgi:hypothetical protein
VFFVVWERATNFETAFFYSFFFFSTNFACILFHCTLFLYLFSYIPVVSAVIVAVALLALAHPEFLSHSLVVLFL